MTNTIVLQKDEETAEMPFLAVSATTLSAEEKAKVAEIAASIDLNNPIASAQFGKGLNAQSNQMTDELLNRIKANDSDVIGGKLNEVLYLARETNSNIDFTPDNTKDRIYKAITRTPFIGSLAKRVTKSVRSELDKYESAAHQIDAVISELDSAFHTIDQTNLLLERNFEEVVERNRNLEIYIQAGRKALAEGLAQLKEPFDANDFMQQQRMDDRSSAIAALQKRIDNFLVLQQQGYQALAYIRMIQSNNTQLSEKFQTIQQVTIPAWKQGFVIRGALTQQKHAVSLTEAMDKTTNELLLQNANLLRTNSVRTAEANQRLIIDPATLAKTGKLLLTTTNEVIAIRTKGQAAREKAIQQLEAMRKTQSESYISLADNSKAG